MNYNNPELIERLAAEFVLGTLSGKARRRFERLMSRHQWVRAVVWRWEVQVAPLAESLQPAAPPATLWRKIEAGIDYLQRPNPAVKRMRFWRNWSAITTSLVVILAAVLFFRPEKMPEYIAVVNDQQTQPMWMITANTRTGQIKFQAINASAAGLDKAFELWAVMPGEKPPMSLGLLPVNRQEAVITLPPGLRALLAEANGLAVSLEPAGGSKTGLPTGPVMYQAPLMPF
ncbi:MAG TPA: anti-sigma factor [Gammaproteobacteria bacterium]